MDKLDLVPTDEPIDPTLFAVNWDVTFEVLAMIILLAFLMERALAQLFESKLYLRLEAQRPGSNPKSLIAFLVGATGCYLWQFDALSILLQRDRMTVLGCILTGAVVAGGSKAAIKLFHDVLDVKSSAVRRAQAAAQEEQIDLAERKRIALDAANRALEEQTKRARETQGHEATTG